MRKRHTRARDCAALRANVSEAFWQHTHDSLNTIRARAGWRQLDIVRICNRQHEACHFHPLCKYLIQGERTTMSLSSRQEIHSQSLYVIESLILSRTTAKLEPN